MSWVWLAPLGVAVCGAALLARSVGRLRRETEALLRAAAALRQALPPRHLADIDP